jgi:uncharacterized membrane protein
MTIASARRKPLGIALVILGLIVNPWSVGYFATTDGSINQVDVFASFVFFSVVCVLGGVQLLWPWVERLSWGRPVRPIHALAVVGLFGAIAAATSWQIGLYNKGHSHTHVVDAEHPHATPEQQRWAAEFYQRCLDSAIAHGWFDFDKAMAQGFQADRVNRTHYPNLQCMFDDVILDPDRPEWLVYDDTPDGKVLMAFMFFTRTLEEVGPTPAGPIAQWHYHPFDEPRCAVKGIWTIGNTDRNGQCREGIPVMRSPEMFHVWFIDHPLGHFTEMKIVSEYFQDQGFDIRRLHPMAVHFAIALFVIAVFLDVAALVSRRQELHWVAWINLALAVVAVATAVATGMTAEVEVKPTHEAHQVLDLHKQLAFTTLGGILLLASWRFALRGQFPRKAVVLYVALSLAGVAAITGAGYYGGELVYSHGTAVQGIDRFTREQYWKQVREVYRQLPVKAAEPSSHH